MFEAKVKEEQREEEKKKKIEQKMAQIDEKNDKVCNKFCDSEKVFPKQIQHLFFSLIFDIALLCCSVRQRRRPRRRWPLNARRSWS